MYRHQCVHYFFLPSAAALGIFRLHCGIFSCGVGTLSCVMWDPVPRPVIEPGPPVLAAWSQPLDHQGSPNARIILRENLISIEHRQVDPVI